MLYRSWVRCFITRSLWSFFFSFIFYYNPGLFWPVVPTYVFSEKLSVTTPSKPHHSFFFLSPCPAGLLDGTGGPLPPSLAVDSSVWAAFGPRMLGSLFFLAFAHCTAFLASALPAFQVSGQETNLQWSGLICTVCPISMGPPGLRWSHIVPFLSFPYTGALVCEAWGTVFSKDGQLSLPFSPSSHRGVPLHVFLHSSALSQATLCFLSCWPLLSSTGGERDRWGSELTSLGLMAVLRNSKVFSPLELF